MKPKTLLISFNKPKYLKNGVPTSLSWIVSILCIVSWYFFNLIGQNVIDVQLSKKYFARQIYLNRLLSNLMQYLLK